MATFFGEILPDSSRAVDEDDDDEDIGEHIDSRIRWSPIVRAELLKLPENKLPCEILIVAVGAAASGFVQSYVLDGNYGIIGAIFSGMKEHDINSLSQMSPSDRTCYIYRSRVHPEIIICQCNTEVAPEQAYSWVNQLFSAINLKDSYISILTTYMASEFKGEIPTSEMEVPFLRSLKTAKYPGTPLCPYLEQPNIVSGLPAQLMTYCQILDVKAVMYICYTDTIFLDSTTMKTFLPLLKSTPIKHVVQENTNAEKTLQEIVQVHSSKNSLYL